MNYLAFRIHEGHQHPGGYETVRVDELYAFQLDLGFSEMDEGIEPA